jgi:uncharacterized membrane protein
MKQTIILSALIFVAAATCITSCKKTPKVDAAICNALDTKWSTAVNTIVQTKCATKGCHDGSAKGGTFTTSQGMAANASDCLSEVSSKSMPKGGVTMTDAERNQVMCWLQDGAPAN